MRRTLIARILLALIACGCVALADEPVAMRIVTCEEQGFSTLCKPEYDYSFIPDGGLTIELGPEDGDPCVRIFKTDAPGADFNAENYLINIYRQSIVDKADTVVNAGEYTMITLGGKEMPALMTVYVRNGTSRYSICAFDLQANYFVQYDLDCAAEDTIMEQTLTALAVAVGNFQLEPNDYD